MFYDIQKVLIEEIEMQNQKLAKSVEIKFQILAPFLYTVHKNPFIPLFHLKRSKIAPLVT